MGEALKTHLQARENLRQWFQPCRLWQQRPRPQHPCGRVWKSCWSTERRTTTSRSTTFLGASLTSSCEYLHPGLLWNAFWKTSMDGNAPWRAFCSADSTHWDFSQTHSVATPPRSASLVRCRFTIFTFAYYWHIGKDSSDANAPNIAGLLFMWWVFSAVKYHRFFGSAAIPYLVNTKYSRLDSKVRSPWMSSDPVWFDKLHLLRIDNDKEVKNVSSNRPTLHSHLHALNNHASQKFFLPCRFKAKLR